MLDFLLNLLTFVGIMASLAVSICVGIVLAVAVLLRTFVKISQRAGEEE